MTEGSRPRSVTRFDGLAERYDRYRPGYPQETIAALLEGLAPFPIVVDVGAGTGISTAALAEAGARAIALEPNADMRVVAAARGLDVRDGTATATGLASECADAVTAFQAFHWFANEAAAAELRRLLRRGGRIALVWNERDRDDPFSAAFRELEERFAVRDLLAGIDFTDESIEPLLREAGFSGVRRRWFDNAQRFDVEGMTGRLRSASYAPREGADLELLIEDAFRLHARYADPAGSVVLRYRTELVTGDVVTG